MTELQKLKMKNKKLTQELEESKQKVEVYKGKYEECLEIISHNHYKVFDSNGDNLNRFSSFEKNGERKAVKLKRNLKRKNVGAIVSSGINFSKDEEPQSSKDSSQNLQREQSLASDEDQLTKQQNQSLKKINKGSNNLNLVFNKCLKSTGDNKIVKDLHNLARGFCKSFGLGCTEICIVDNEVIDLMHQTEKM